MNILILNGSPHPQGTTSVIRTAFTEELQKSGHEVTTINTASLDIHPCIGCDYCRRTSNGCTYKDDMERINPALLAADCVVFVTPLYYFGMSTQLKAVIDRFYANNTALREQKKRAVLLAACGDADNWTLDALDAHYHAICSYLHWDNVGEINALGMYTPADLEKGSYVEDARALAASISSLSE